MSLKWFAWRSDIFVAEPGHEFSEFNVLNQLCIDIEFKNRKKPPVNILGFVDATCFHQSIDGYGLCRKGIDQTCNPTVSAHHQCFNRNRIDTCQYFESVSKSIDQSRHIGKIPSTFLDCLDGIVL